jgi:hypothetical protein
VSAPLDKMTEKQLRAICKNQRTTIALLIDKGIRQRNYINRLIAANDDCVFRIECELLRDEVRELRAELAACREDRLTSVDVTEAGPLD